MPVPPVLTSEDRAAALEKAARARKERSDLKADIKAGRVHVADVLGDRAGPLWPAYVRQVLEAVPGVGKVRAAELMGTAGIAPSRRVRGLGTVQRAKLTELVAA